MAALISGIQQIGIGVSNVREAFDWYRNAFGMDIPIFDDESTAELMLPYTGGQPRSRHAIYALNIHGGGGFEIWQYVGRTPQPAEFNIQLGDLGIYGGKIKSHNVAATFNKLSADPKVEVLGGLVKDPAGADHFFVKDPYGNIFQVVNSNVWFKSKLKSSTGGAFGALIGSTNIERSLDLYRDVLGYDTVVYDETGVFEDFAALPSGHSKFRRVLLRHSKARVGSFSRLFGPSEIELVQVLDRAPKKIFENRFWGDLGFIHLCYDIKKMDDLQHICASKGFDFTVDSANSFDMGEAAGRFSYIEDPDGTLIEFVETHRMPVVKKLGWFLDLKKRPVEKPLPDWLLKALAFNRVKS